jgi:hypothetical protein
LVPPHGRTQRGGANLGWWEPTIRNQPGFRGFAAAIRKLAQQAWPFAPIVVAVIYAVQRTYSTWFYSRLGTSRAEVGLGNFDGLIEGVVAFILAYLVANVVVFVGGMALVRRQVLLSVQDFRAARARRRNVDPPPPPAKASERTTRRVLIGLTAVFTVFFFVAVPVRGVIRDSDAAKRGENVRGFPTVSWTAIRSGVIWLDEPPPALAAIGEHCLMYLGAAGGVTVFYDVDERHPVRVPTSRMALTSSPAGRCPA